MRKQLLGIGLILLGIMFAILSQTFDVWIPIINIWIPIIDVSSYLWGGLSLLSGLSGIVIVFRNVKDKH